MRLIALFIVFACAASVRADNRFIDLTQPPASVEVVLPQQTIQLRATGTDRWSDAGIEVQTVKGAVTLSARGLAVKKIHLRWEATFASNALFLGDAWERAYGDLEWLSLEHAGPMPWYFLVTDGATTHGYGVMTAPAAMCVWKADAKGIDLWADVRSGGVGVELGDRVLNVCTIVAHEGKTGESAFAVARAFCKQMCPKPRLAKQPIYGFNDWYCAYGKNTAKGFLDDAQYIASLSPAKENAPFMVIDDGWQDGRQGGKVASNPWLKTNDVFGSTMPAIAAQIKAMNARPGLWYRPLEAWPDCPPEWILQGKKKVLDPSNPAVLKVITENMTRFREWGFEMVKHDFSTWEIIGRWGNKMNDDITPDGWAFSDHTKTTAEIILNFYHTLSDAAGDDIVLNGCNTISHLSAGVFEMARIGDDTSGTEWPRTLKMGVNALAFRAAQHDTFYAADADCVGLAKADAIPWERNKQWLDLVARSGTPLFISWPRELIGPREEKAFREALEMAAKPQAAAEPLDWTETRTPSRWMLGGEEVKFQWSGAPK